jgi:hypothetical protein
MPLYPNMEDEPGKHVLIKVDSRPGCNNLDLLSKAHFRGLYIFPGIPNATSVKQETDRNYGLFKGTCWSNLNLISLCCFVMKERTSLLMLTICLITYGGECPQTHVICQDAGEKEFRRKRNLKCWAAVRAVLFTMQCLTNKKVQRDGNDKNNPEYNKCQIIQSKNYYATLQLMVMGYNVDLLKKKFDEEKIMANAAKSVTTIVENNQERPKALVKASTNSKKWFVVGVIHSTVDDSFIAPKMGNHALEIAKMNMEKKAQ